MFGGLTINAQIVDSRKLDKNSILNKYESEFLNDYLKEQRDTFDFSHKRIVFVTGSNGATIGNKKDYFSDINEWDKKYKSKIATSIVTFGVKEKELSGGYDAILTYWVKIIPNKLKIINQIKISR